MVLDESIRENECVLEEKSEIWSQDLIWAVGFVCSIARGPAFKGEVFEGLFGFLNKEEEKHRIL